MVGDKMLEKEFKEHSDKILELLEIREERKEELKDSLKLILKNLEILHQNDLQEI